MPSKDIEKVLGQFKSDDLTVKLVSTIFGIVPGGPEFVFYNNLEGAVDRIAGGDQAVLEKARELMQTDEMGRAVWVADAIDTADAGISIYTGVKNLFSLFGGGGGGEKKATFEADPEQATDAGLKAVALAFMIYKMFPGGIGEKISMFREIPAGNEMGVYYAVAEIALPFTDNLAEAGGNVISKLINSTKGGVDSKVSTVLGGDALSQASGVLGQFTGPLGQYVDQAKGHTGTIMEKIKQYMPSASTVMNVADSATGAAAAGVDLMPVWRFLGARLVAEAAVLRAMKGV